THYTVHARAHTVRISGTGVGSLLREKWRSGLSSTVVRRLTMRGEVREDLKGAGQLAAEGLSVEKQQEQLLMNKLASNGRLPAKPQSAFLQRKLQQQRKFFDSGDYAMNKDKAKHPPPGPLPSASETALNVDVPMADESLQIPRPDTVPQRKASIIYPSVHSKLSPQPHVHHSSHDDVLPEP
uniref:cAMP regulated phosphoprotein 19 n=1 Tax=Ascaris lumbricoides TaxID=6252 RepID=A0A0M3HNQ0_ASCLU